MKKNLRNELKDLELTLIQQKWHQLQKNKWKNYMKGVQTN